MNDTYLFPHQTVTLLGSTGSVGVSSLNVIRSHPDRFTVFALTAHSNLNLLFQQCIEFKPRYALIDNDRLASALNLKLKEQPDCFTEVLSAAEDFSALCQHADVTTVIAAIVGAAGLLPTLEAVIAGKKVLLANKESLVMAGKYFMQAVEDSGAQLLPIDSEHNAIFQCLPQGLQAKATSQTNRSSLSIKKLLLTGSGGPFRCWSAQEMAQATPKQACKHPKWSMGKKISVDSATLMNKGLELLEAKWLFNIDPNAIDVIIHPQSIVHSLVEYRDGSMLAQLSHPDMMIPITHALAWPDRMDSQVNSLDLVQIGQLDFEAPDLNRFPALAISREVASQGMGASVVLNAANEVAVEAFLSNQLSFPGISVQLEHTLETYNFHEPNSLDDVLFLDADVRQAITVNLKKNAKSIPLSA